MSTRFEGKNVEEALAGAAAALGVERYQLTYHVVLEKRGFLGGMKRVVIEAEVNEAATVPEQAKPLTRPRPAGATLSPPKRGEGPRRRDRGRRGGRREERGERREREPEAAPVLDIPEQGPESEQAGAVHTWCQQVLDAAKLSLEIRTEENEEQVMVRLYGRDSARLIDRNGELLDALQVLANKSLAGRTVEKDIELDCAAFKERRIEELGQRARATADRVRREGREQLLPAMTPIERRIVHLALQDDQDVVTESRGDGFYKRVAIKPRPASAETPQQTPES